MTEPTREIFWNIQYPWIMYSLAAIATAVFIWAFVRIPRRWRVGQPANRFNNLLAAFPRLLPHGFYRYSDSPQVLRGG